MKTYRTSEVAKIIGVHPNTVRLYEEIGFISAPERLSNGYRVYTGLHIAQMKVARTAMKAEVLQNGLRSKAVGIARLCASGKIRAAEKAAAEYSEMIDEEITRAKNAASAVEKLLSDSTVEDCGLLTAKQAAAKLGVTPDALRNWERNALFGARRKENGYRVYSAADMELLNVIRTLRCANYSLSAILRLITQLSAGKTVSVSDVLNTPSPDEEIISVCDKLLVSLMQTKADAIEIMSLLREMDEKQPST